VCDQSSLYDFDPDFSVGRDPDGYRIELIEKS